MIHPRIPPEVNFSECRQYYAAARTSADSIAVDQRYPIGVPWSPSALTCGQVRHALDSASRAHPSGSS